MRWRRWRIIMTERRRRGPPAACEAGGVIGWPGPKAPFSARKTGQSPRGLCLRIACAIRLRWSGEGHRLRHAMPDPQSGRDAKAFRPAPACPGRRGPLGVSGGIVSDGTAAHGRGKRIRFLFPPGPVAGTRGRWAGGRCVRGAEWAFAPLAPLSGSAPNPPDCAPALAKAIAFATRCPWAKNRQGRQSVLASARPALGGRFSPAGSGAGLSGFEVSPLPGATRTHGRGKRMRFLFPPGLRGLASAQRGPTSAKRTGAGAVVGTRPFYRRRVGKGPNARPSCKVGQDPPCLSPAAPS